MFRFRSIFCGTVATIILLLAVSPAHAVTPRIVAGAQYTVLLKNDSTVWAWGDNNNGQLGDGTTTDRTTPVQVGGLSGIIAIASSWIHTVALKSDGTVWVWGWNSVGQLGDGTTTDRTTPVQVSGLSGIIAIDAGRTHTVVLENDDTVWAWGGNNIFQLGDGTTTSRTTPVQAAIVAGVVSTPVPVMEGWWLLPGMLAGVGIFTRRRKE